MSAYLTPLSRDSDTVLASHVSDTALPCNYNVEYQMWTSTKIQQLIYQATVHYGYCIQNLKHSSQAITLCGKRQIREKACTCLHNVQKGGEELGNKGYTFLESGQWPLRWAVSDLTASRFYFFLLFASYTSWHKLHLELWTMLCINMQHMCMHCVTMND